MATDKKAFEDFYHLHLDKVYRFVFFRVAGNRELAEDLVSEVFVKALGAFGDYDEAKSRSAWILTIARNHLANYYRDRKQADPLPEDLLNDDHDAGNSDARWLKKALQYWQKEARHRQVYELLEHLGEDERQIVTFHYLFGYSYNEIAEMRGSTESAVKVAAHRIIKKMRNFL